MSRGEFLPDGYAFPVIRSPIQPPWARRPQQRDHPQHQLRRPEEEPMGRAFRSSLQSHPSPIVPAAQFSSEQLHGERPQGGRPPRSRILPTMSISGRSSKTGRSARPSPAGPTSGLPPIVIKVTSVRSARTAAIVGSCAAAVKPTLLGSEPATAILVEPASITTNRPA